MKVVVVVVPVKKVVCRVVLIFQSYIAKLISFKLRRQIVLDVVTYAVHFTGTIWIFITLLLFMHVRM